MTNYIQYSWRRSQSTATRPNQSVLFSTLVKFAIVAMVLQLVVPGLALAIAPPTPNWGITWTSPAQCSTDGDDENPDTIDLYGTPSSPAIAFASDENFRYFKEVVLSNPSGTGGFDQKAWVVLFQVTPPNYQYLAQINGKISSGGDKVQLFQNSTEENPVDFGPPPFNDNADGPLIWEGPVSTYANVIPNGDLYIVEWAIPLSAFVGSGITDNTTKFFATSSDANNFNKDHLNCYERGTDLAITKTDSADPVDASSNLTYTVTVTNNGPEDATGVLVTDVLPSGVTYVSHTASTGTFDDTSGVWTVGGLSNGASATLTITVAVGSEVANTTISNTATVSSTTADINTTNNSATEDTTVNEPAPEEGTLSVVKVIVNDNGGTVTDPSQFSFQVNSDTAISFEGDGQNDLTLPVGIYTVSEPSVAGYSTTYVNCSEVEVTNGGTTPCTITNDDIAPVLILDKFVVNDDGGSEPESSWTLTATGLTALSGPGTTANDGDVFSDETFSAGTYILSEAGPEGYASSGWSCTGGTQVDDEITLALGETAYCTITNDDIAPTVTINKTVTNDNGGTATAVDFTYLFDGVVELFHNIATPVTAGSYTISESPFFGYTPSEWSGDCDSNGSIFLIPGQDATCNITNDDQAATLIVYKEVSNLVDGELQAVPGDFYLTVTSNAVEGTPFTGVAQIDGGTIVSLNAGSYSVAETGGPENYNSTMSGDDPSCSGTIGVGETKYCFVYNTSIEVTMGRIIVYKDTVPARDVQIFNLNLSGVGFDQDFPLSDTSDPYDSLFIEPGTYSLSEDVPAGWQLDGVSCVSGVGEGQLRYDYNAIELAAGKTIFCTVNNIKNSHIIIQKNAISDSSQEFTFTNNFGNENPTSFGLVDDETSGLPSFDAEVLPGTYTVSEGVVAGWQQESATCSDGSPVNAIQVSPGETVTCTFTNEQLATITLVKNTVGPDGTFDFTLTGEGLPATAQLTTTENTTQVTYTDLDPDNTYTIMETEPEGWVLTSATCDNDDLVDNITPNAGENITCTFTNVPYGTITIEKVTNPVETAQTFEFDTNFTEGNVELGSGETFTSDPLEPGSYEVTELTVDSWSLTGLTCDDADEGTDTDGNTAYIDLDAGENITCTFTNTEDTVELGAIHGYKWNDTDSNGERGEEELLSGWTVFIDENENAILDEGELFTLTSDDSEHFGWYWFNNLPYGEYSVCEVNQTYWTKTYPAACHTVTLPDGNPQSFPVTPNAVIGPEYNFGNHYNETSDLSVTKEVSDTTPDINQTITYTITVSNDGPDDATNVVVTDDLPSGVTFVSASPSQGAYDSGTGEWTVGTLADESSATLTIEVTVNSGTGGQTIINTASADSDESDPNSENSADSAEANVNQPTVIITGGGGGGGSGVPSLYIHTENVGGSTDTTATITWFTNLAATSRVVYDTVAHSLVGLLPNFDYAFTTTEDTTLTTFHSLVISGLTPGTNYYFRPVSSDVSNTVTGVELSLATSGSVAGAQTGPADTTSESTLPPSGGTTPPPPPSESGEVAGVQATELAQAPVGEEPSAPEPAPEPEQESSVPEPASCNPWTWLLVALNVLATAWFWKKYSKSQKWNKYLWIINLALTAILTWVWLGSCSTWVWLLILLVVSILYALFTSEGEPTPAQA